MADNNSPPKTPTNIERIPRDESFKTCKAEVISPNQRQRLRMTPIRTSILSGGKPFKEVHSNGRKCKSRRKTPKSSDDMVSIASDETFIRCEEEAKFERDSLDPPRYSSGRDRRLSMPKLPPLSPIVAPKDASQSRFSSTPKKKSPEKNIIQAKEESIKKETLKKESPKRVAKKPLNSQKQPSVSCRRVSPKKAPRPPPFGSSRPRFTPRKALMPPPPPLPFAASEKRKMPARQNLSKYLTGWNNSRMTRTQSFKSTAELEKEFINSLRSF